MKSLNIGIFGNDAELMQRVAAVLGKKGTTSDITLYDTKSAEIVVTAILPHSYPEKIQALFYAVDLCDFPVLVVGSIDTILGETIVALSEAGFEKGFVLLKESYLAEQLKPLLRDTKIAGFEFISGTDDSVLNELRLKAFGVIVNRKTGPAYVEVDHSFNVKGVGTVVLGIVKGGQIKVYDKLKVLPGKKETVIKSIQKHDDNFSTAEPGDRVGLCLKDVTVDDVGRGAVLSNSAADSKKLEININVNKFYKQPVRTGQTLYVSAGMQYAPFKVEVGDVEPGKTNIIVADFEKPIAFFPDQKVFLLNPNLKTLRVAGNGFIAARL